MNLNVKCKVVVWCDNIGLVSLIYMLSTDGVILPFIVLCTIIVHNILGTEHS